MIRFQKPFTKSLSVAISCCALSSFIGTSAFVVCPTAFAASAAKTAPAQQKQTPMMFLLETEPNLKAGSGAGAKAQKSAAALKAPALVDASKTAAAQPRFAATAAQPSTTATAAPSAQTVTEPAATPVLSPEAAAAAAKNATARRKNRSLAPCTAWVDGDVEPKAALLCVHGLGLHNESYKDFGERMAKAGIATYAVDVRGFGSWQEAKGKGEVNFEDCLTDVADTLKFIHKANPGLPVFILGESMGGAIALRVTSIYPNLVDGLISCVPSGDRFKQKHTDLKVALHFLQGANKKFDVGSEVIQQASSSNDTSQVNEGLKKAWGDDPLARLNLSPKELWQFQHFMNENNAAAKSIKDKPVLMVQGWEDNLVKWTGTLELWKELPTDDKQIELIPNAKHLIFELSQFNDPALNVKVDRMVTRWIDDHIQKPVAVREAQHSPTP